MSPRLSAAVLGLCLLAAPAAANDSTASMGAGGLVLKRTDGIAMVSEDLYVSAREVRVKYRFLNHTAEPIETLVAFPMPDISGSWRRSHSPVCRWTGWSGRAPGRRPQRSARR